MEWVPISRDKDEGAKPGCPLDGDITTAYFTKGGSDYTFEHSKAFLGGNPQTGKKGARNEKE